MIENIDIFYMVIQFWIAIMLTVQSVILYRLLPEIKKVSGNSEWLGKLFNFKKDKIE